jgi:hypothetical protein
MNKKTGWFWEQDIIAPRAAIENALQKIEKGEG